MKIVLRNACKAFRLLRENVQLRKKVFSIYLLYNPPGINFKICPMYFELCRTYFKIQGTCF